MTTQTEKLAGWLVLSLGLAGAIVPSFMLVNRGIMIRQNATARMADCSELFLRKKADMDRVYYLLVNQKKIEEAYRACSLWLEDGRLPQIADIMRRLGMKIDAEPQEDAATISGEGTKAEYMRIASAIGDVEVVNGVSQITNLSVELPQNAAPMSLDPQYLRSCATVRVPIFQEMKPVPQASPTPIVPLSTGGL